ncbi:hypothetical protein [Telmatospirillum sp.]|uniref:hypothetical protein n=1 Tax=Telmatospirillum sp. TaxID=2079197 RepID=UPI00283B3E94|nr:hypothetical protein [Telmatospirillum sp.]MDR3440440.1 hypothetical protein [Telmatospirillum sp.]
MKVRRLKAVLSPPLVLIAAVVFLFEEVLWAWVAVLAATVGRWAPIARIEAAIGRLPPYLAMLLFILPWAIILPVKLLALWLLATGHVLTGAGLFAGGELFGVGFLARIYVLCRPSLSTLAWFVRLEGWALAASAWAHAKLNKIAVWRETLRRLRSAVATVRGLFHQEARGWLIERMRAARRLVRAQFQR